MFRDTKKLQKEIREHALYGAITDISSLRCFMEQHVICVWDFMCLLKSLQQAFTCTHTAWVPPVDAEAARLVNEIVLAEESDRLPNGTASSHFEMYLRAMEEVGCDLSVMNEFIDRIRSGQSLVRAVSESRFNDGAKRFVRHTIEVLQQPIHVQAAVFFHSRENLIPGIFQEFVREIHRNEMPVPTLMHYFVRHAKIDADEHTPKAQILLGRVYQGNSQRMLEGEEAAAKALKERLYLWDAIYSDLKIGQLATMADKILLRRARIS